MKGHRPARQSAVALDVVEVDLAESVLFSRLLGVGADHAHSGEALLDPRREIGEARLHRLEARVHALADELGDQGHHRHRRQGDDGEPEIDARHQHQGAE